MYMGRIMAVDYGRKRVGLAVSDPLKIIATGLDTVHPSEVLDYIARYMRKETVELLVVGFPRNLDYSDTDLTPDVRAFIRKLTERFALPVEQIDERYTSKIAARAMIAAGMKKTDRRKKENTDRMSAVIILQSYLESVALKNTIEK
jgi:putative Holliday junction resolvase